MNEESSAQNTGSVGAAWAGLRQAAQRWEERLLERVDSSIHRSIVAAWLTLSIASVLFAAVNWYTLSRQLDAADRVSEIREASQGILRLLLDIETAQRGFTILGDDTLLEPLNRSIPLLPAQFGTLIELTREEPQLLEEVVELRAQSGLVVSHLQSVIQARRDGGIFIAAEIMRQGEGKRLMDAVRSRVSRILSRSAALRMPSAQGERARRHLLRASLTSLVSGVIGIGAGFLAFYISRVALRHQRQEKELLEANLQAERRNAEKSNFLATMSHEIRTPMNAILGFGELLAVELTDPRQRQYLQSIRTSAASLLELINDILEISKIEAGVVKLELVPTDIREICEFIRTVFKEQGATKGIQLDYHVSPDIPKSLLLDVTRLRQILLNLVGNSVKFTDRGSVGTSVRCEPGDSGSMVSLIIEVRDTGVGIPDGKLEAIFEPFVQVGSHREKEREGTGLGLAIVRRLTEIMGGTITIESAVGQGTTIEVRIPNVVVSAHLPVSERLRDEQPVDFAEFEPATLLLVDDHEMNLQLMAGIFNGTNHKLVFGADGHQAVELARAVRPSVVLLDVRMHGMDGLEALREIRRTPGLELLPVIAVTASTLQHEEAGIRAAFNGYLQKPFSRRALFDQLAQFLPRRSAAAEAVKPAEPADVDPRLLEAGSPAVPVSSPVRSLPELLRMREVEWPLVKASMAVNEIRSFARRLIGLAAAGAPRSLDAYARSLAIHADGYDVMGLERDLDRFPALVDELVAGDKVSQTN